MPRSVIALIALALGCIAIPRPGLSATIIAGDGSPCDFLLYGRIVAGDDARLIAAGFHERTQRPPILCLHSVGGSLSAAIDLMYAVDGFGWTAIMPDAECLSVCALVFMAGRGRDVGGYCRPWRDARAGSNLRFPAPAEFEPASAEDLARLQEIAASRCYAEIERPGEDAAPCACPVAPIVAPPLIRPSLMATLWTGIRVRPPGHPDGFELHSVWQAAYLGILSHNSARLRYLSTSWRQIILNACNNLVLTVTARDVSLKTPPPEAEFFRGGPIRPDQPQAAAQLARLTASPESTLATAFDGRDVYRCWASDLLLCVDTTNPAFASLQPACLGNARDSAPTSLYQLHPLNRLPR